MKLLQNGSGNFLNMSTEEAKALAKSLLKAVKDNKHSEYGGNSFVKTIVISEDRHRSTSPKLDVLVVGVSPHWLDVHIDLEAGLKPRGFTAYNINRDEINVNSK